MPSYHHGSVTLNPFSCLDCLEQANCTGHETYQCLVLTIAEKMGLVDPDPEIDSLPTPVKSLLTVGSKDCLSHETYVLWDPWFK